MDTGSWAALPASILCVMRGWAVSCQTQELWACGQRLQHPRQAILFFTQLKPHPIRQLRGLLLATGALEAECHRQAGELKEEHYLQLYPAETWYAQEGH